jgi:HEAT repeat protein
MLAFCTTCWTEISAQDQECGVCGANVDDDPRSYEQKLLGALSHPLPDTRSRICWLLGQKHATWAVPHLLRMLKDCDLFVRVAALRALGEIGDPSSLEALNEAVEDGNLMIRLAAQGALDQINLRLAVRRL